MATSLTEDIRTSATWSIVLSVLMMVTGVIALLVPAITGVTVTLFMGWLLIFSGILHLAYAWQAGRAGAVVWEILVGILYGGIGFYLQTYLRIIDYPAASTVLLVTVAMVMVVDAISSRLRDRLV